MQKQMTITKRQGQVWGRESIHRWLDGVLDFAANGEHLLVFRKPERRRSNDQNALAWLWFTCIAEETGSSKDDVHDHYCMKFLRRPIVFNGREEMSMRGTSGLTTAEMKQFLDMVQADAASELGIILPDPEDLNYAAFEEYYRNRL